MMKRECQECGHIQYDTRDPYELQKRKDQKPFERYYYEAVCKKCKSEGSLDFGEIHPPIQHEEDDEPFWG